MEDTNLMDESRVQHIAALSRLSLSHDEVKQFAGELGSILNYASNLPDLHDHIEASALRLEEDVARPYSNPQTLLQNAVALDNGYVKVPAILDKSES
jgi:aspartyl-tRNA(Asn)/glutamyl-tRNA(Gln) amidotransferase subunit C